MKKLPEVIAEEEMTIVPGLTLKVMVLDSGQRIIPVEDMQRACEWLGMDMATLTAATGKHQEGE